jgi:glucose-6-phosphate isomerase
MAFGAWCDRQYGFDYTGVRAHHGLAWFPLVSESGEFNWEANPRYRASRLEQHPARSYPELDLDSSRSIYGQFVDSPERIMFVSDPARAADCWSTFVP